jgi:hypothetical protein
VSLIMDVMLTNGWDKGDVAVDRDNPASAQSTRTSLEPFLRSCSVVRAPVQLAISPGRDPAAFIGRHPIRQLRRSFAFSVNVCIANQLVLVPRGTGTRLQGYRSSSSIASSASMTSWRGTFPLRNFSFRLKDLFSGR